MEASHRSSAILVIGLAGFDAAATLGAPTPATSSPTITIAGAPVLSRKGVHSMHPWTCRPGGLTGPGARDPKPAHPRPGADDLTSHPSPLRRPVARLLAALSRGSAAAVRRLDDCIADDLGRSLAPSEQ